MRKLRPPDDGIVDAVAIELALTGERPDVAIRLTDEEVTEAFRVGLAAGMTMHGIGRRVKVSGDKAADIAAKVRRERLRLLPAPPSDTDPIPEQIQQAA